MLAAAFDDQDERFASAFSVLREAIAQRAFPAACIAVTHKNKLIALKSFGHFVFEEDLEKSSVAPPFSRSLREGGHYSVGTGTLFDLASVTKAVATTTMAMILYERGILELDAPITGIIPEFAESPKARDPRRREVTFRMLLAHSSGLPAYEKLFLKAQTRHELLHAAFTTVLTADPGTRAEYSDIGFIILGIALERIAHDAIDSFCQREIFVPLAMAHTTFNPPAELRPQIPPTADEREKFRRRIIQGEVQDENAFVLGGVAGHAGLFSPAEDLARFAVGLCGAGTPARELPPAKSQQNVSQQEPSLRPETVALFTRRESAPGNTSHALGWDTPSSPSQSGKYFGPRSFGHLGYTGTSLWIDPDRELSITLLTNRTWPDCANQAIKQVRPAFHDAIIEALKNSVP
jgi:CubicO group peptidase (beta-lactamase class C family)